MVNILCLETATNICSVALFSDNELLGYQEYHLEKSHSNLIPGIVDSTIKNASIEKADLHAVAVSQGPGSYTGLRIGVSTAKGLCFALNIPLIAVDTLQIMAVEINRINFNGALLCPMIDARRMEVYASLLNSENEVVSKPSPYIIDETSFAKELNEREVWFFGNGATKCKAVLGSHPNARFIDEVHPTARAMGALAFPAYKGAAFADVAYFEPFYLKDFRLTKPKSQV